MKMNMTDYYCPYCADDEKLPVTQRSVRIMTSFISINPAENLGEVREKVNIGYTKCTSCKRVIVAKHYIDNDKWKICKEL